MNFNLLRNTSTEEITMLKDINNLINIDKAGKFKYCYISNSQTIGIINFISKLEENQFYTLIPIISMFAKDNDPHIILSKQILVTSYSSSKILDEYLSEQLDKAILDFGLTAIENGYYHLIFKYKKVNLDFSKLPN